MNHKDDIVDDRNPAPVDMGNIPYIYRVLAPSKRWLGMGFLNHQPKTLADRWTVNRINHINPLDPWLVCHGLIQSSVLCE